MNLAFYLLVAIGLVALYFCIAFIFRPIGSLILKIFGDFKSIVSDKSNKEK